MKYLKLIKNIIMYLLIFFLCQIITGFIFGIVISSTFMMKYGINGMISEKAKMASCIASLSTVMAAVAGIISLVIFTLIFKKRKENLLKICKFTKVKLGSILFSILAAISLSYIAVSILVVAQNVFKMHSASSAMISASQTSMLGIVCGVVFIPILEEILFRGIIFNELRKNLNIILSIIIQALIFAVAHFSLEQGIYTFLLGVTLAAVYTWTESILSNITIHIVFNIFGSLIVPYIMKPKTSSAIIYLILGFVILIGSLVIMNISLNKDRKVLDV